MRLAVLYSGGKDSNYALHKANQNNEVVCLINLKSENQNSYMFQSVGNDLIKLQAEALEIPLLQHKTQGEKERELDDLKKAIEIAKNKYKIDGVVTGAIKSAYQSSRIQNICNELDLWCFNPIWQIDEDEFIQDLIDKQFEIKLFGVFSYPFTQKDIGKEINQETLNWLKELRERNKISIAGEGGEYESFVLYSPLFKKKIEIGNIEIESDSENSAVVKSCSARLVEK